MASAAPNTIPFPKPFAPPPGPDGPPPSSQQSEPPSPAPEPAPAEPSSRWTAKPWHRTVISLLSEGASVVEAVRHVGRTEDAFFKTCRRHPEFLAQVQTAREYHYADTAERFHETEALARSIIDRILRDEAQPPGLRLRASLAVLNRKGPHWLPSPILCPANLPEFDESPDSLDNLDNLEDTVNPAPRESSPEEVPISGPATPASEDPSEDPDAGLPSNAQDKPDTQDNLDRLEKLDNLDNAEGPERPRVPATATPHPDPLPTGHLSSDDGERSSPTKIFLALRKLFSSDLKALRFVQLFFATNPAATIALSDKSEDPSAEVTADDLLALFDTPEDAAEYATLLRELDFEAATALFARLMDEFES